MKLPRLLITVAALLAYPASAGTAITGAGPSLDFGQVAPTIGTIQRSTTLCLGLTRAGPYSVRGAGNSNMGGFALSSGEYLLDYQVHYSDTVGQPDRRELRPNTIESGFVARAKDPMHGCPAAELSVTLQAAELAAAAGGRYFGVLVLTIIPE